MGPRRIQPDDRAMNDVSFLLQFATTLSIVVVPIVLLVRLIAGEDDSLADLPGGRAAV